MKPDRLGDDKKKELIQQLKGISDFCMDDLLEIATLLADDRIQDDSEGHQIFAKGVCIGLLQSILINSNISYTMEAMVQLETICRGIVAKEGSASDNFELMVSQWMHPSQS